MRLIIQAVILLVYSAKMWITMSKSDISVDTELSDNYLSEQAMCLILEKMASEIGINAIIYSILVITLMKMCIITVIFHGNV